MAYGLYSIDMIGWLFTLCFILWIVFSLIIISSYRRQISLERELHRAEVDKIRETHQSDIQDVMNRLMAGSYSEYEEYKEGNKSKKPTTSTNFIKNAIDKAEKENNQELE